LRDLHDQGARRVVVVTTSAYSSYSSCRQYREDLAAAVLELAAEGRRMEVDRVRAYYDHPGFARPMVEVQTEALGLSAEEVEQLITVPMEQDLLIGVPWLDTIRSESLPGLSSIVLLFKPGTDLTRARQMVAERMTQAVALPHVSKPPTILQPFSSTSRVVIVGLSSKSLSPIQTSVLARWTIKPRLLAVPGVANVAIWGQRDRQLQVLVDKKRLQDHKISLLQVLETTGNALWVSTLSFVEASTPGTGGFIDTSNQRLGIRHILPIVSADGLAQIPIEDTGVRLGDIADVVEDHQPLIGDGLSDNNFGLLLVIEKFPGTNSLEVPRGVDEALAELRPGLPGLEIDPSIFRPADFVATAFNDLSLAAILGFGLVMLTLALFFFRWRTALISLVASALAMVAAGLVLYLSGASLNMMALTGLLIAIGFVVDDAIIDVENITRRLQKSRRAGNAHSATMVIIEASREMRSATFFALLITLLTALPIFFIGDVTGAFFQPMAVAYGLAVLASMVVALTVTPALCLMLLGNAPSQHRKSPLVLWLEPRYQALLARIIRRPRPLLIGLTAVALIGLAVVPFLSGSLIPNFKERDLLIRLSAAPGTSQPEMSRISGRISQELQSIPGVRHVGALVGRAVQGDQQVDVNSAELWVSIDSAADYDKTVSAMRAVAEGYPGIHHDVQTYLNESTRGLVMGTDNSIVVRVYGSTDAGLRSEAAKVQKALAGINGILDTSIDLPVQQPTLETEVDISAAGRLGLKPGDVRRAAATLMSGTQVGNLFEEQKVFEVVVWSTPETHPSLNSMQDLLIDTPGGGYARLGDVAQLRIVPSPSVVRHEGVKRYLDVTAAVQGRELAAVAADIKSRLQQVSFALEYHAEVLNANVGPQATQTRLLTLAAAVAIGHEEQLSAVRAPHRAGVEVGVIGDPDGVAGPDRQHPDGARRHVADVDRARLRPGAEHERRIAGNERQCLAVRRPALDTR